MDFGASPRGSGTVLCIVSVGVLTVLASSLPAADAFTTGHDLLAKCIAGETVENLFSLGFCAGYLTAIMELSDHGGERPFCIPADATNMQIKDTVLIYLQNHPEQANLEADSLVIAALIAAFPCSKMEKTE